MPNISLPAGMPGMIALSAYRPDVYTRLASLADLLLQHQHPLSTLTPGDRELIASYVSSLNQCAYCTTIHGAVAAAHLQDASSPVVVDDVIAHQNFTSLSPKMTALLEIARLVTKGGKEVSKEAVDSAKERGATEMDVHDTVLVAAMFGMFNRYVDGLGTEMPRDMQAFVGRGKVLAKNGYAAMVVPPVQKAKGEGAGVAPLAVTGGDEEGEAGRH